MACTFRTWAPQSSIEMTHPGKPGRASRVKRCKTAFGQASHEVDRSLCDSRAPVWGSLGHSECGRHHGPAGLTIRPVVRARPGQRLDDRNALRTGHTMSSAH